MLGHKFVPVVALIGGVGSGKSSVARWVSGKRDVVILDGDQVGHQVLKLPSVQEQIHQRFRDSVFDEQGRVNRAALAREVFGSSDRHRKARTELHAIVHPRIRETLQKQIEEAKASRGVDAVILDAAVLLEANWQDLCDRIVFLDAPYQLRLERVAESRGWDEEKLQARESSQLSLEAKRRAADYVIENSGPVSRAGTKLEQILSQVANEVT